MPLLAGAPAPWFHARTHARPDYAFSSVAGHYVLLAFFPEAGQACDEALALFRRHRPLFDEVNRLFFGVVRDPAFFAAMAEEYPGVRWFFDPDGQIAAQFRLLRADGGTEGQWVFLDPMLRVIFSAPLDQGPRAFSHIVEAGDPDDHAGVSLNAPVLIVPRVLEPALCRRLIDYYHADGGAPSGVMREVDGKTVPVLDDFKKRRDAQITDPELQATLRGRISARLLPEIQKALQFKVTRMERYIVARYDAKEGGYFRAHRDNTTKGTAHRQFACSINLNAEEFTGGDLKFPEFGRRTYRPPTGGAVIFSCSLLHEATPVTKGTRYAFLPFFYDEAHARIRQQNAQFLQTEQPQAAAAES
jgi:predicted 2-oxoglutarate/Fe(II)-dependent dioxygenase YbiX/peroxiredoxin